MPRDTQDEPALHGGHPLITWAAMQALPPWQREVWAPELLDLAAVYSLYGDTYYTNQERLARYVLLPDGREPPWAVGMLRLKNHIDFTIDYWESPFYELNEAVFVHFLRSIAENVAAGRLHDAAQFAGTIAHHIEDSGAAGHTADNGDLEFVKDYLEVPPGFEAFPLHGYTELSPPRFRINGYSPRLYGLTPEEAGANYLHRLVELVLFGRKRLFPFAQAAYARDETKAERLRLETATFCAYAYADFMYTATCIGTNRFEPAEVDGLKRASLTPRWPYRSTAWAPAPYFEPGPLSLRGINLDGERRPVPCALWVKEGGTAQPRHFEDSLGSGAFFEYHYRLPAGTCQRFTCLAGIHATLGARRPVDIELKADGRSVFNGVARPGAPALPIDVEIAGCRDLQLIASGPRLTDPDGSDNHVVWAMPMVWKG